MSDYFERVEDGLREAVRRRAHLPWYSRLRPRFSRPAAAAALAVGLVAAGSALAASGVFRTGQPIGANVPGSPDAYKGVAVARSVHVLGLEVSDPEGGPPWGLRIIRTTRGLKCVQVGRLVDGRIGVLGEDGAFRNDGLFHPLSSDFLNNGGCGTEDARRGRVPERSPPRRPRERTLERRSRASGCGRLLRTRRRLPIARPPGRLLRAARSGRRERHLHDRVGRSRHDAHRRSRRGLPDRAALPPAFLPQGAPALRREPRRGHGRGAGTQRALPGRGVRQVIRAVSYRDGHSCRLPTTRQVARLLRSHEAGRLLGMGCPSVGYVAAPSSALYRGPAGHAGHGARRDRRALLRDRSPS